MSWDSLARTSVLVFLCVFGVNVVVAQKRLNGKYKMFVREQSAGEEKFDIKVKSDGSIESDSEITYGPPKNKIHTTATKNGPVSFSVESAGTKTIYATFANGKAKVAIAGQDEVEVKTQASVTLENGVWHHFYFFLTQYDIVRGGKQNFNALLPSQATEVSVQVERESSPAFDVKGQSFQTDKFRVITTRQNLSMEIWTDKDRLPLLITVPVQGIKVIRQDANALAEAVFANPKMVVPETANTKFSSEEVSFQNGNVKFAGTLTAPKTGAGPHAAAIIITGSGGQDRDGSIGVFNLYKTIAESLSSNGLAVLRVDDRGVGKSSMPPDEVTSYKDLIADSRAAFDYLLKRKEIDPKKIVLIGHSEGAETALTIASEDKRVAAIVLLAGAARNLEDVALEQSLYQLALQNTIDPADKERLPFASRNTLKLFDEAKANGPVPAQQKDKLSWFREHAASNPIELAKRVECPVLILNGERDALVLSYHSLELARALIKAGNRHARLRIFPNLSHVFTQVAPDKNASADKATEINREFLQTLQDWTVTTLSVKRQ